MNKRTTEEAINDFRKIHGDKFDYSLYEYKSSKTKSIMICENNHHFLQTYESHMKGFGCAYCSKNKKYDVDEFISKCKEIQIIEYDYSKVFYKNAHTKIKIICNIHGEFEQLPMVHLRGAGCPKCNYSKGEKYVELFLKENNINYMCQYKFKDCININELLFDFYLPDLYICIEFNGIQHYQVINIFGGNEEYNKRIINDDIKELYCRNNNIRLITIKQNKKHIKEDKIKEIVYNDLNNIIYN